MLLKIEKYTFYQKKMKLPVHRILLCSFFFWIIIQIKKKRWLPHPKGKSNLKSYITMCNFFTKFLLPPKINKKKLINYVLKTSCEKFFIERYMWHKIFFISRLQKTIPFMHQNHVDVWRYKDEAEVNQINDWTYLYIK